MARTVLMKNANLISYRSLSWTKEYMDRAYATDSDKGSTSLAVRGHQAQIGEYTHKSDTLTKHSICMYHGLTYRSGNEGGGGGRLNVRELV
ncbi:abc-type transport permease component [Lasius niger]|uniref:Abc-type transport permease component n=1 Tax=Lasius niger TaxID=67767 RepID=A0A0J7K5G0_LASNI|nr:abc-type transport permease component [Lasius niger]